MTIKDYFYCVLNDVKNISETVKKVVTRLKAFYL